MICRLLLTIKSLSGNIAKYQYQFFSGCWVQVPSDEYVDICVTHIVSSSVVYAKLVGEEYHEKLELLETAINNSFENASVKSATQLEVLDFLQNGQ